MWHFLVAPVPMWVFVLYGVLSAFAAGYGFDRLLERVQALEGREVDDDE